MNQNQRTRKRIQQVWDVLIGLMTTKDASEALPEIWAVFDPNFTWGGTDARHVMRSFLAETLEDPAQIPITNVS